MFIEPHKTKLVGDDFVGRTVQSFTNGKHLGLPYLSGDKIKRVYFGNESCLSKRREVFVMDHLFGDGKLREIDIHSINFLVEVEENEIPLDYQI